MIDVKKVFDDMKDMNAAVQQVVYRDKADKPIAALVFIRGKTETKELLKAIEKATADW
jgi:hypothetical protein